MDVLVEGVEDCPAVRAGHVPGAGSTASYLDAGEPGEIRRVRIVDALLYEMEGE